MNEQLPEKYSQKIKERKRLHDLSSDLSASVIIVTYKIEPEEFRKTLEALDSQGRKDFEVVVVDNGNSWEIEKALQECSQVSYYLKLKKNYGLNIARNVGAQVAQGEILIFLDDDGVPAENFIDGHLRIYKEKDAVAARGKVVPKNPQSILNKITAHYDLGDKPFPYLINTEGNSSVKRKLFLKIEGVDESLSGAGGHEGAEISYRLAKLVNDKDRIYYNPWAVIYHDYSPDLITYLEKQIRHSKHQENLEKDNPKLFKFTKSFDMERANPPEIKLSLLEKIKLRVIKIIKKIILWIAG